MPAQITNYQCPSCTGPLHFSSVSGRLECEYCGAGYDVAEIEALYAEKEHQAAAAHQAAQAADAEQAKASYLSDYDSAPLLSTTPIRDLSLNIGATEDEVRLNWMSPSGTPGKVSWYTVQNGDFQMVDAECTASATMAAEPVERGAMITEEMVREGLEKSQTVKLTSFNTVDQTDTQLSVGFSDINSVIEEAQTGVREKGTISRDDLENIVNFTNTTGKYKFVFFLDRSNFAKLVSILPEEATPLVTMFGPSLDENNPVTREDYYEFLNEAFSAYETPDRIRTMVDNASMTLRVRTDGSIISQRGGRIENNNTVVFEIPLMDFILLEKPIDLEVVFN